MHQKAETDPDKIETKKLTLVGLERHMDVKRGFMDEMDELVQRLISRLSEIEGKGHPDRYVGYWQQVAGERDCGGRMYLAAAEVSAVRSLPEGMVAKALPESEYAIWYIKNGEEGSVNPWATTASTPHLSISSTRSVHREHPLAKSSWTTMSRLRTAT